MRAAGTTFRTTCAHAPTRHLLLAFRTAVQSPASPAQASSPCPGAAMRERGRQARRWQKILPHGLLWLRGACRGGWGASGGDSAASLGCVVTETPLGTRLASCAAPRKLRKRMLVDPRSKPKGEPAEPPPGVSAATVRGWCPGRRWQVELARKHRDVRSQVSQAKGGNPGCPLCKGARTGKHGWKSSSPWSRCLPAAHLQGAPLSPGTERLCPRKALVWRRLAPQAVTSGGGVSGGGASGGGAFGR